MGFDRRWKTDQKKAKNKQKKAFFGEWGRINKCIVIKCAESLLNELW